MGATQLIEQMPTKTRSKRVLRVEGIEDYTPQTFDTISGLNAYEHKKGVMIRSYKMKYEAFEILLRLVNSYCFTGKGLSVYSLDMFYVGNRYTSIHNRLSTLFKRGLVERYQSNGINHFKPTSLALVEFKALLTE